jgi:hypothetical protein
MNRISMALIWLGLALGLPRLASAQNIQSFVVSGGNDAAACTRSTPCLSFQGALAKTAAGGRITCLDAADFGPVTIAQAVSIVCDGPRGAIFRAGNGSAVRIQAGAGDAVVLRGLDLRGDGGVDAYGIRIDSAGSVVIQDATITGFLYRSGGSVAGAGILDQSSSATKLVVAGARLSANGTGIVILPSTSPGVSRISLSHLQVLGNEGGLSASTAVGPAPIDLSIDASVFAQNSLGVLVAVTNGGIPGLDGPPLTADIAHSTIVGNGSGVVSSGRKASLHIGSSVVANNLGYGLSGGNLSTLVSYGDNQIADNGGGNYGVTTSPRR